MAMARSLGVGSENGKMLVKGHKLPVIDKKSSVDLMYNRVTIINNTRVGFKSYHHTHKGSYVRGGRCYLTLLW